VSDDIRADDIHAHARLHIGGDPHSLPPDVTAHIEGCGACRKFRDETLMLDGRLRQALEIPLPQFRTQVTERAPRRYAMAASVLLGMLIVGGFWVFRPAPALAGEVVTHVLDEMGSWNMTEPVSDEDVKNTLRLAGVQFDSKMPIVYAMPCPFMGRRIAHLVVQTPHGPMTVMLLPHEHIESRRTFSKDGMRGVLVPAGAGGIAILSRDGAVPDAICDEIVSDVRW
jgi:hypothetical protein